MAAKAGREGQEGPRQGRPRQEGVDKEGRRQFERNQRHQINLYGSRCIRMLGEVVHKEQRSAHRIVT